MKSFLMEQKALRKERDNNNTKTIKKKKKKNIFPVVTKRRIGNIYKIKYLLNKERHEA